MIDKEKIGLYIDKEECMGCHLCEIACKEEHKLGDEYNFITIIEKPSGFDIIYCHHCTEPPCKYACPVNVIEENERGIVLLRSDYCIGCLSCKEACPFEAVRYDKERSTAVKCDLCIERLADKDETACMSACPVKCIYFSNEKKRSDNNKREGRTNID